MREANGFIYVSGLSSRRVDGTYIGMEAKEDGSVVTDLEAQIEGCLDNLSDMLGAVGADLSHLVDVTVFLTDMVRVGYRSVRTTAAFAYFRLGLFLSRLKVVSLFFHMLVHE